MIKMMICLETLYDPIISLKSLPVRLKKKVIITIIAIALVLIAIGIILFFVLYDNDDENEVHNREVLDGLLDRQLPEVKDRFEFIIEESNESDESDTLVLCDTKGATLPTEIYDIVKKCVDTFDGAKIGVHCHNDIGTAVANSLMAVSAGATHIQGTLLGFGERCGNANLSTIIGDLALKLNMKTNVNLMSLTNTANAVAEICNIILDPSMPYVGAGAFSHKAGTHADAVMKESDSFEHIRPEEVGNMRHILVSEVSGRSVIVDKLKLYFPFINKSDPKVKNILDRVKELENQGYQFEGADASFLIMAQKAMGTYTPSFSLEKYEITASNPDGINKATVSLKVGNDIKSATADGNGPVNALDKALREVLSEFYPEIENVSLIDYKVRVIDSASATGAMVRVSITSRDGYRTWTTVGVSTDIIKASWKALVDSLEYRLSIKE